MKNTNQAETKAPFFLQAIGPYVASKMQFAVYVQSRDASRCKNLFNELERIIPHSMQQVGLPWSIFDRYADVRCQDCACGEALTSLFRDIESQRVNAIVADSIGNLMLPSEDNWERLHALQANGVSLLLRENPRGVILGSLGAGAVNVAISAQ